MKRYVCAMLCLALCLFSPAAGAQEIQYRLTLPAGYDWTRDEAGWLPLLTGEENWSVGEDAAFVCQLIAQEGPVAELRSTAWDLRTLANRLLSAAKQPLLQADAAPEDCLHALEGLLGSPAASPSWTGEASAREAEALLSCALGLSFSGLEEDSPYTWGALGQALSEYVHPVLFSDSLERFEENAEYPVNWGMLLTLCAEALPGEPEAQWSWLDAEGQRQPVDWAFYHTVTYYVNDRREEAEQVRDGSRAEPPEMPGVEWFSVPEYVGADTRVYGYTRQRVRFTLENAQELGFSAEEGQWTQNILYGRAAEPRAQRLEPFVEKGYTVAWDQDVSEPVYADCEITGRLIAPEPDSFVITYVWPQEMGGGEQALTVEKGAEPVPPQVDPGRVPEGYEFAWERTIAQAERDETVRGLLTPKQYTIEFIARDEADGTILLQAGETLSHGQAVVLPAGPEGYTVDWTGAPETAVSDCTVEGTARPIRPLVVFLLVDEEGVSRELSRQEIEYGGSVTLPTVEIPEGCEVAWTGPLSGIRADATVTGTVTRRQIPVTIEVLWEDGSIYYSETQQVPYGGSVGAASFVLPDGCGFAWDAGSVFDNICAPMHLTGRLTRRMCNVTFAVYHQQTGAEMSSMRRTAQVPYDGEATLPNYSAEEIAGGSIVWSGSLHITGDVTIRGEYQPIETEATPVPEEPAEPTPTPAPEESAEPTDEPAPKEEPPAGEGEGTEP